MSDFEDAWDAEDFNPDAGFQKPAEERGDEWEGEDEGLVIEEEPKPKGGAGVVKKSKQERIEEKKAKRREEQVGKKEEEEEEEEGGKNELTAEVALEEKRKAEEAQRQSDLESAKELFGESVSGGGAQLERMNPKTPEEFEEFSSALSKKITEFGTSTHYTLFLEGLLRTVCAPLDVEDLRQLSTAIGAMATEKQKQKQPHSKKKKGKVALGSVGKGSRRVDVDSFDDLGADFDDFM